MTFKEFKKQAGAFTLTEQPVGSLAGAAVGAGVGGLATLFSGKERTKLRRIMKALGFITGGAITGAHLGSAVQYGWNKYGPSRSLDPGIVRESPAKVKDPGIVRNSKSTATDPGIVKKEAPKPLPGDSEAKLIADWAIAGKPVDKESISRAVLWQMLNKYGPHYDRSLNDAVFNNAERYLDNYKNKAIEVPQGGKPRK